MSNANNDPLGDRGNAGPQPAAGQPYYQQPAYGSPQPSRGGRFFAWIRSSQVKRGHDRWIGGVCDGIARRLGWNTTLVRALMVVATLFFGAGAAFYGLAWFVLPDERDNQILAEDLINGKWDWNCIGALLCCLVAICLPGAGWFAFALAALVLWLLLNRQIYAPNVRPAQWQQPRMVRLRTVNRNMVSLNMEGLRTGSRCLLHRHLQRNQILILSRCRRAAHITGRTARLRHRNRNRISPNALSLNSLSIMPTNSRSMVRPLLPRPMFLQHLPLRQPR
ncbi:MAG: PspC domain-containing protein [Bifidobacterium sp.]